MVSSFFATSPEYVTSEPLTGAASLISSVASVGPLQYKEPRARSNRVRKSMESAIRTSPEKVSELRARAKKSQRPKKAKPKTPSKPKKSPQKKSEIEQKEKPCFFFFFSFGNGLLYN